MVRATLRPKRAARLALLSLLSGATASSRSTHSMVIESDATPVNPHESIISNGDASSLEPVQKQASLGSAFADALNYAVNGIISQQEVSPPLIETERRETAIDIPEPEKVDVGVKVEALEQAANIVKPTDAAKVETSEEPTQEAVALKTGEAAQTITQTNEVKGGGMKRDGQKANKARANRKAMPQKTEQPSGNGVDEDAPKVHHFQDEPVQVEGEFDLKKYDEPLTPPEDMHYVVLDEIVTRKGVLVRMNSTKNEDVVRKQGTEFGVIGLNEPNEFGRVEVEPDEDKVAQKAIGDIATQNAPGEKTAGPGSLHQKGKQISPLAKKPLRERPIIVNRVNPHGENMADPKSAGVHTELVDNHKYMRELVIQDEDARTEYNSRIDAIRRASKVGVAHDPDRALAATRRGIGKWKPTCAFKGNVIPLRTFVLSRVAMLRTQAREEKDMDEKRKNIKAMRHTYTPEGLEPCEGESPTLVGSVTPAKVTQDQPKSAAAQLVQMDPATTAKIETHMAAIDPEAIKGVKAHISNLDPKSLSPRTGGMLRTAMNDASNPNAIEQLLESGSLPEADVNAINMHMQNVAPHMASMDPNLLEALTKPGNLQYGTETDAIAALTNLTVPVDQITFKTGYRYNETETDAEATGGGLAKKVEDAINGAPVSNETASGAEASKNAAFSPTAAAVSPAAYWDSSFIELNSHIGFSDDHAAAVAQLMSSPEALSDALQAQSAAENAALQAGKSIDATDILHYHRDAAVVSPSSFTELIGSISNSLLAPPTKSGDSDGTNSILNGMKIKQLEKSFGELPTAGYAYHNVLWPEDCWLLCSLYENCYSWKYIVCRNPQCRVTAANCFLYPTKDVVLVPKPITSSGTSSWEDPDYVYGSRICTTGIEEKSYWVTMAVRYGPLCCLAACFCMMGTCVRPKKKRRAVDQEIKADVVFQNVAQEATSGDSPKGNQMYATGLHYDLRGLKWTGDRGLHAVKVGQKA